MAEHDRSLLHEVDAMRADLDDRVVPVDMALSVGTLYHRAGRYPDAIDWYRRATERALPAIAAFRRLQAEGVVEAAEPPTGCARAGAPGSFESALKRASALELAGDEGAALACYRAALSPIASAFRVQAEAWRALDARFEALSLLGEALEITPDDPDALFLAGAVTFEIDPERLDGEHIARAREAWRRFAAVSESEPRAEYVRRMLPHVEILMMRNRPDGAPFMGE